MAGHCSVDADEDEQESEIEFGNPNSLNSPLIFAGSEGTDDEGSSDGGNQFSILDALFATLRKSLVMCSVGPEEDAGGSLDIGWPTDVQHVAHVTFDRFDGFLGLPVEFEPDVPCRAPSASASIFGVSARSMQCSYDKRGNSVPTMLLLMQRHLYLRGGLQAEGIFRITAENSQEVYVREQLNTGIVPLGIDVHCLAGLIKAWFRELPTGVLDCITPDQMMQCNNEEECSRLVGMLPTTEAALLDWAINLMADVVEHEHHNKMNARNIAMVFAPNMTQMADPLTALIHAVQVMNFLKTLIMKTLREREEADVEASVFQSCCESPRDKEGIHSSKSTEAIGESSHIVAKDLNGNDRAALGKFLFSSEHAFENNIKQSFLSFDKKSDAAEAHELSSEKCSPANQYTDVVEGGSKTRWGNVDVEGLLDRINIRKRVRKLCRHPVFQFSKYVKKSGDLGFVNSRCGEGREAWAS